ncbi:hypothetical protein ASG01_04560 [Chryseobacterium sp. Leaf180]|uniref:hypothetical protein n=1 Tax=Chryseobacterium sp. Leaf180 TaxID=1736289 RepID=UPI0006F7A42A|nr:hypothetical protein [Chryseobacterium sp. Leaf180]KQR95130.1 hypothetical protein ASG01_04560 [Chryseobacterium sp. Leaf180]
MKTGNLFIVLSFFVVLISCKKEKDAKQVEIIAKKTFLKIDTFEDSLVKNKFVSGCIMSLYKKSDNNADPILMQGNEIKHVIGRSIFIMKIDNTLQKFDSNDERDVRNINRDLIRTKLTNKEYEVEITTYFEKNIKGAYLNKYFGTIKVKRKKDSVTNSVDYVGEMVC